MGRVKVIGLAVLLGAIGGIAPIAFMAWLSWNAAIGIEQDRLDALCADVLERTEMSLEQAHAVLSVMVASRIAPCSTLHIAAMRKLTADSLAIEEIGYFENKLLKCTSWGPVDQRVIQSSAAFTTSDGLAITPRMIPTVSGGGRVMAVQMGNYNVLINIDRFTDIMSRSSIHLGLARVDGPIIVESVNDNDRTLIGDILAGKRTPSRNGLLVATRRQDGWIAVAAAHKADMLGTLRSQQLWMVPVGAFSGLFIVALVIRSSRKRMSPTAELGLAVRKREFFVEYQPIVDLSNGRCIGAEALVRWRRPDGEVVRPDFFVPLAEETLLILPITDLVIEAVVRDLGALLNADRSLHIAINLSSEDVRSGRVLPVLARALEGKAIQSAQIWLEATERGFIDIDAARLTVGKAKKIGHLVAIDDFGTGYSSLQYLQDLPVDALKIDKSFVASINRRVLSSPLIDHIIAMAKSLGLFIIAEGVETPEQGRYLADRGVHYAQGWLYSKPLSAEAFQSFLSRRGIGSSAN